MSESRRDFLKTATVAGGALAAGVAAHAYAGGNERIRVGLVGCGGRGTGAAAQSMRVGEHMRLVAMGDAFADRLNTCYQNLSGDRAISGRIDVPESRRFVGLDAYQRVLENCDLVILATPPGFRPQHLQAAVNARKHIFTEKPVAVDAPGIRLCLELFEQANRNRLCIVAGTQRRYQTGYVESMQRIHNSDIGTITSARCYWNQGSLWHRPRDPQWSDLEWHIRNWLYFTYLSGDHIVEQHVHNLDVINWALGNSHPLKAVGLGGRQVRTGPEFGHIYDHFAIDYEYPNDVHVMSQCRQIAGCKNNISESVTGTRGTWHSPVRNNYTITGDRPWSFNTRDDNNPYENEHVVLVNAIRRGQPINALRNVAESTLTAIMGRMACYTGREITWEMALNSRQRLVPENLSFESNIPVPPVAMPGSTEFV